ncbi:MAG: hypothetical protein II581_08605 [Oscillospiraceae bacterium]|nr:hypothetical protein [Oscillospiraceae bacterium]
MKYQPRPGIVKTQICGRTVLIPARQAFDACRTVQILPMLWAGTWNAICKGCSREEILTAHRILVKNKTEEERAAQLDKFLQSMCDKGFLIAEPEETAE